MEEVRTPYVIVNVVEYRYNYCADYAPFSCRYAAVVDLMILDKASQNVCRTRRTEKILKQLHIVLINFVCERTYRIDDVNHLF